jgi:hypothetical protein
LDNGSFSGNLEDLSFSDRTITEADIDDLSILREFDIIEDDQGSIYLDNCSVVDSGGNIVISGHGLEICVK